MVAAISRSAGLTSVVAVKKLLFRFGSMSLLDAPATSTSWPLADGTTTMVIVTDWPLAIVPMVTLIFWPATAKVPLLGVTDLSVTPGAQGACWRPKTPGASKPGRCSSP